MGDVLQGHANPLGWWPVSCVHLSVVSFEIG